jgi:acyl-[acyl-carrier-protein] desaturase
MVQMSNGRVPTFTAPVEGLAYVTLQELATRVSHCNTGRQLEDEVGKRIMGRVAGDEMLHHVFYRDLTTAALEIDPSSSVIAIDHVVRTFAMPGVGIPGFESHARVIDAAGIYGYAAFHDLIVVPIVLETWKLPELTGLTGPAEEARERCLAHIERLGRIARRKAARRPGSGSPR